MARELGLEAHAFANAEARIDAIALTLADARLPGNAEAELMGTGRVLDEWLSIAADSTELRADLGDLLLPSVLTDGKGHEAVVVAAALAACERAGLRFGVVGSGKHLYLAHSELTEPYVLAPRFGWRFVDATDLREGQLSWLCPHELAVRALDAMLERATTCGLVDVALKVSELRVDMPMDSGTQQTHRTELAMAQARFN